MTKTDNSDCPNFKAGTVCSNIKPYCGESCSNTPYCQTTCWTSASGSAWSGAGRASQTNLLYCENNVYANCHFSGPSYPTGNNPNNPILPCKINKDGKAATCRCKVFSGENYINITGIMNLGVYYETVKVCGSDGVKCQNSSSCPGPNCRGQIPPVCKYLKAQHPNNPESSFIPGADLISTFGLEMVSNGDYTLGKTACKKIRAAGCMTQPCKYEKGSNKKFALCQCPLNSPRDVDLSQSNQKCNLESGYVWE